jgi:hypothetical protein
LLLWALVCQNCCLHCTKALGSWHQRGAQWILMVLSWAAFSVPHGFLPFVLPD